MQICTPLCSVHVSINCVHTNTDFALNLTQKRLFCGESQDVFFSLRRMRRTRMVQNAVGLAAAATVLSREKTRACFNGLYDRLREELEGNPRVHDILSVELQVAVNLYYLAGTSKYRTIGNLFGIVKVTVCECVQRVCSALEYKLLSTYVKIKEGEALNDLIDGYKKFGFQNFLINGIHVNFIGWNKA